MEETIADLEAQIVSLKEQLARQSKIIGYIAEKNPQLAREAFQYVKLPEDA